MSRRSILCTSRNTLYRSSTEDRSVSVISLNKFEVVRLEATSPACLDVEQILRSFLQILWLIF